MNIVEIPVRNITVKYPSEWEEMTRSQAIRVGWYLYLLHKGNINADQFRKLVVDLFINRVNNMARKLTPDQEMDLWGNEWVLAETVNFFFEINKDTEGREVFEIMPRFVKNLVPWFRRGWFCRRYYGPGYFMQGMVFAELKDAMTAAQKFLETNDDQHLDQLANILYRPRIKDLRRKKSDPEWDGQERVAYNAHVSGARGSVLPRGWRGAGIKYMAFLYMMGCLNALRTDADGEGIEIDGVQCAFSMLFRKVKTSGDDNGVGMMGVMMAMAESGVFGNIHETAKADVWDVLVRMYQLELQRREIEAASAKR